MTTKKGYTPIPELDIRLSTIYGVVRGCLDEVKRLIDDVPEESQQRYSGSKLDTVRMMLWLMHHAADNPGDDQYELKLEKKQPTVEAQETEYAVAK